VAWASLSLGVLLVGVTVARGAPADPFAAALPGRDTQPTAAAPSATVSGSVSEQQGTASYVFPIEVPPGRNGMAPSLALSYSSGAPLRGGIAVGWSLDLPRIELDPQASIVDRYKLSGVGAGGVLVPVTGDGATSGTRYRVEIDESFTRVERVGNTWTVSTNDGITRTFLPNASDHVSRWNISSERDPFGNEVRYTWTPVDIDDYEEYILVRVEYSFNSAAGLGHHASIQLNWEAPNIYDGLPIGARTDHHFGLKRADGVRTLKDITSWVLDAGVWRKAREVRLTYDTSLAGGSRLRMLSQIDVTAYNSYNAPVHQPPLKFGYGPMQPDHSRSVMSVGGIEHGTDEGPEMTRMDLDGDGILDRVSVLMPDPNDQYKRCRLVWRKGLYGGWISPTAQTHYLPTAWWAIGGPFVNDGCTLNGQFAIQFTDSYSSGGDGEYCTDASAVQVAYHFMDWDQDGDPDLLTGVWSTGGNTACGSDFGGACYRETRGHGGEKPCEDSDVVGEIDSEGNWHCFCLSGQNWNPDWSKCHVDCAEGEQYNGAVCVPGCSSFEHCTSGVDPITPGQVTGPSLNCPPAQPQAEQDAGQYVWRVFLNDPSRLSGQRFDPATGYVVHAPQALPLAGGPLGPPQEGPGRLPGLADIDGDGWTDLVRPISSSLGQSANLYYHRGRAGGFSTALSNLSLPESWNPSGSSFLWEGDGAPLFTEGDLSFADVNGDGLPDVFARPSNGNLFVSFNDGETFTDPLYLDFSSPTAKTRTEFEDSSWFPGLPLTAAWRADRRRFDDVDDDGMPELLVLEGGSVQGTASTREMHRINVNRRSSIDTVPSSWEPLERLTRAVNTKAWYRASDVVDLTGDGVPDLVTATPQGTLEIHTAQLDTAPMRLLRTIDNGRGSVTTFEYAPSTAPGMVELADGETNSPRWLVHKVRVDPGAGQPEMTTRYAYANPVRGLRTPSQLSPAGFLGFKKITSTRSGQQGEDSVRSTKEFRYDFGPDHRGHLVREVTALPVAGGGWRDVQHVVSTWTYQGLLGGLVGFTYNERTTTTRVGEGGAASVSTTVQHSLTPFVQGGKTLLYTANETTEWEGEAGLELRSTVKGFQVRVGQAPYSASDYRVILTSDERRSVVMGFATVVARTTIELTDQGLPRQTNVFTGSAMAATVREFDPSTGLLLTEKKPSQVPLGASGKLSKVTYDPTKVFVEKTTNELGQSVSAYRDPGTGALVKRTGPNVRNLKAPGCTSPITWICPVLAWPETETWVVDGFGRVVLHRVAIDLASGHYGLADAEVSAYVESEIPNRVITQRLRDFGGSAWVKSEAFMDGLGRPYTTIERNQQSGRPDAVTTYAYDAGGAMRSMAVPDPQQLGDSTAQVTYTYDRDGLGRVTRFERPDGSEERVVYGAERTSASTWSPIEGLGAATEVRHDGYGRLVEVKEYDNPTPGTVAVTYYGHDALDRVTSMLDADGNQTILGYDWRGLRTSVARGNRVWSYTYDLDGNLTTARSPMPAGANAAHYTSTNTYDVLGRVTWHQPATRGMTTTRLAQLGIGATSTSYDSGANGVGRVASISQSGLFGISYTYDVRGHVSREQRNVFLNNTQHGVTLSSTQSVQRLYNALGAPTDVVWDDGTRWKFTYDARNQPQSVEWVDPSTNAFLPIATYARDVAGRPRFRMGAWNQKREWRYDMLGRVATDRVYQAITNVSWAERNYGYDGFGRLEVVGGTINSTHADATMGYDRRGRVVTASGPGAYQATLAYTKSGNITHANISGAQDALARNVQYHYGATDPQAVDRITDVGNGANVGNFTYDSSGSMLRREIAGDVDQLVWDGDDHLREMTVPGGFERYYYAGAGQRIVAVGPDGIRLWFGESETRFSRSGVQEKRWHHIATGEPIARVERLPTNPVTTTIELQYSDALQNLMITLAPNGSVTSSFLYGAFGEVVAQAGANKHRRQFNGKEADAATNLRYYGYRYYDPVLLRWISADPLFRFAPDFASTEPQRANLYAFSLNNPLSYYDPDGRDAFLVHETYIRELARRQIAREESKWSTESELPPSLAEDRNIVQMSSSDLRRYRREVEDDLREVDRRAHELSELRSGLRQAEIDAENALDEWVLFEYDPPGGRDWVDTLVRVLVLRERIDRKVSQLNIERAMLNGVRLQLMKEEAIREEEAQRERESRKKRREEEQPSR